MIKLKLSIIVGLFLIEACAFQQKVFGQKEKEKRENVFLHPKKFYRKFFPKLRIKPNPPDSLYIKTYPNYLAVSVHLLSPSIRTDISSKKVSPIGASKFRTNVADIAGFNMGYRFIAAGFSFLLNSGLQTHSNFAKSDYRTATIKLNGGARSFQFMYLRLKGFTDINSSNSPDPTHYVQRPDVLIREFKFEGLYNPSWKKYSYIAPFAFTQRQLKSKIGFLLKAGVYYSQLSGDSALIGRSQRQYFDNFNNVNVIRTFSIKLAPGAGANFVFHKHYNLSFVVFPSYDLCFYKYIATTNEKTNDNQTFIFALDGKASVGYQSKRLYAGLRYELEQKQAALQSIQINSRHTYLGLEVGYRFNTPRFVKKGYKDTMPPGT